jgi:hypothetical protein
MTTGEPMKSRNSKLKIQNSKFAFLKPDTRYLTPSAAYRRLVAGAAGTVFAGLFVQISLKNV